MPRKGLNWKPLPVRQEHHDALHGLRQWARKQGGAAVMPKGRVTRFRHTCEKAADPAFRKPGDCFECSYEQNVLANLTPVLGEPEKKVNGTEPLQSD
jgi:hypothetical protein